MKKVLCVIDMQNDFVSGSLGTPEARAIIPAVKAKVAEYLRQGQEIIFTQDTHDEAYPETQEGRFLPIMHCAEGTDGWNIVDEVMGSTPGDIKIFKKSTFGSLQLAEYLRDEVVSEIELIGVCTDICVVSNALILKAYLPETPITVDAACCAGVTPKKHKSALEVMRSCQINVINGEG